MPIKRRYTVEHSRSRDLPFSVLDQHALHCNTCKEPRLIAYCTTKADAEHIATTLNYCMELATSAI